MSGVFVPTLLGTIKGASILKRFIQRKKEKDFYNREEPTQAKDDFSQSKAKEQDSRFQGQEHPPKIERQNVEQSHDHSHDDSRSI